MPLRVILVTVSVIVVVLGSLGAYLLFGDDEPVVRRPAPAGEEVAGISVPDIAGPPPPAPAPDPPVVVPARIVVDPKRLDFGLSEAAAGLPALPVTRRVRIRNTGGSALEIDRIAVIENPQGVFSMTQGGAPCSRIDPGASCEVSVTFAPASRGAPGETKAFEGRLLIDPLFDTRGSDVVVDLAAVLQRAATVAPPPLPAPPVQSERDRLRAQRGKHAASAVPLGYVTPLAMRPYAPLAPTHGDRGATHRRPDRYASPVETVQATPPVDRARLLTPDVVINAVTLDSMNSRIPGRVRASVERSVFSAGLGRDRLVLLPKGTVLVGAQTNAISRGDARIAVAWYEAIRPDGVRLTFGEALAGADQMGRSGLYGIVDDRFWERYGAAVLFSLLDTGSEILVARAGSTNADSNRDPVLIAQDGATSDARSIGRDIVGEQLSLPPVIVIPQGTRITVRVIEDLYFPHYAADGSAVSTDRPMAVPGGTVRVSAADQRGPADTGSQPGDSGGDGDVGAVALPDPASAPAQSYAPAQQGIR